MSQTYSHFINGTWSEPASGAYFASTNPANLEHLYDVARATNETSMRGHRSS